MLRQTAQSQLNNMRHQKKTIKLGRVQGPRKSLLRGLANNLILHETMVTTKAKAKAIRSVIEPLITKAKKNRPVDHENIIKILYTGQAIKKLITEIAPRYSERHGGYTRIIKIGPRFNDRAEMVRIEFV